MLFLICTPLSIWKEKNIQLSSLWVWLISLNMISSSKHITRFCSSWLNITVVYADPISFSLSISCRTPKSNICSVSLFLSVCVHVCICTFMCAGVGGHLWICVHGGQRRMSAALIYSSHWIPLKHGLSSDLEFFVFPVRLAAPTILLSPPCPSPPRVPGFHALESSEPACRRWWDLNLGLHACTISVLSHWVTSPAIESLFFNE